MSAARPHERVPRSPFWRPRAETTAPPAAASFAARPARRERPATPPPLRTESARPSPSTKGTKPPTAALRAPPSAVAPSPFAGPAQRLLASASGGGGLWAELSSKLSHPSVSLGEISLIPEPENARVRLPAQNAQPAAQRARAAPCPRPRRAARHSATGPRHALPHSSPPPPCTKWTRRVPHPVLIGHASSLAPYLPHSWSVCGTRT